MSVRKRSVRLAVLFVFALVALGSCSDDNSEGCVFDPVDTVAACEDIATDLGCATFSFNPDTQTCHAIDCPPCNLANLCEYVFVDVPSQDACRDIGDELECATIAFDAADEECSLGQCSVCADLDTDFDGDFDFDGDEDIDGD